MDAQMNESKRLSKIGNRIVALLIVVTILCGCHTNRQKSEVQFSEFGKYKGYSEEKYDGWKRNSQYVTMRDGVKIAVDIIRPAQDGEIEENPLPALLNYYSYLRASLKNDTVLSLVDQSNTLQNLVRHGYSIVVASTRGRGASFGQVRDPVSIDEAKDAAEIVEWMANQSWCNGHVGMVGHSYSAQIQLMTAGLAPPHLKALFPSMGAFDIYQLIYPGGIFRGIIPELVSENFYWQDFQAPFVPVDADTDGSFTAAARKQHEKNVTPMSLAEFPFHDSEGEISKPWTLDNPMTYIQDINASSVAVYHWAGWHDVFARDVIQYARNLKNPQKLTIGPWAHSDSDSVIRAERYRLYATEQLRWFDYWLKGIDNGIMKEPSIYYAVISNPGEYTWSSIDQWPPAGISQVQYYFSNGNDGSITPVNNGALLKYIPVDTSGEDRYKIDYSTCIGKIHLPRAPIQTLSAPDMTPNDEKSLTYTTPSLDNDMIVIGSPVVSLTISSTSDDVNIYAYLEEIDKNGKSFLITDGCLKASHRKESEPPFDNMDLPYHRHFKEDILPMPKGKPVEIRFDLMPIANLFNKGHRIRISISCANDNWDEISEEKPVPEISMYRNKQFHSGLSLPVKIN
jgi:putative CocE/NonD family hydrolase